MGQVQSPQKGARTGPPRTSRRRGTTPPLPHTRRPLRHSTGQVQPTRRRYRTWGRALAQWRLRRHPVLLPPRRVTPIPPSAHANTRAGVPGAGTPTADVPGAGAPTAGDPGAGTPTEGTSGAFPSSDDALTLWHAHFLWRWRSQSGPFGSRQSQARTPLEPELPLPASPSWSSFGRLLEQGSRSRRLDDPWAGTPPSPPACRSGVPSSFAVRKVGWTEDFPSGCNPLHRGNSQTMRLQQTPGAPVPRQTWATRTSFTTRPPCHATHQRCPHRATATSPCRPLLGGAGQAGAGRSAFGGLRQPPQTGPGHLAAAGARRSLALLRPTKVVREPESRTQGSPFALLLPGRPAHPGGARPPLPPLHPEGSRLMRHPGAPRFATSRLHSPRLPGHEVRHPGTEGVPNAGPAPGPPAQAFVSPGQDFGPFRERSPPLLGLMEPLAPELPLGRVRKRSLQDNPWLR